MPPLTLIRFDWAMKNILRDKANFGVLEGFLSELLGSDLTILELLESESDRATGKDKINRVDLMVRTHTDERIIIEVQCERQVDYLSRILFGTSKVIVENLNKGAPYALVKKVISVTIAYCDLGQGDDYVYHGTTQFEGIHTHHTLQLSSDEKQLYGKQRIADVYPQYYLIRVNSFDQETKNTLDEWIYFLKNEKLPRHCHAKGLKEAAAKLDVLQLSGQARRDYERYLESLRDRASFYLSTYDDGLAKGLAKGEKLGLKKGREKGRQEGEKLGMKKGREEGRQEGKQQGRQEGEQIGLAKGKQQQAVDIARKLLAAGTMDLPTISQITRLSEAQILSLSK